VGEVPLWYSLIRAAQYLGVAPWELDEQPVMWQLMALSGEKAEIDVAKARAERRKH
jgi:hypothetical protein